jgi:hypothetical protein
MLLQGNGMNQPPERRRDKPLIALRQNATLDRGNHSAHPGESEAAAPDVCDRQSVRDPEARSRRQQRSSHAVART